MSITTRSQVFTNRGKGLGYCFPFNTTNTGGTGGTTNSGAFTLNWQLNNIGTTLPGTLVGLPIPSGLPSDLQLNYILYSSSNSGFAIFARLYKLGTLDLTGTGNKFTHDIATFPVLKTQFGEASKPLSLIPFLHVTTATNAVAPVFRIRTNAGPGVGYTNQDGNNVIGNVDFTFPNASTSTNSMFLMRLNYGDSAIRDIFQIDVTTSGNAGAATIYGAEFLAPCHCVTTSLNFVQDNMFAGFSMSNLVSAVATSGTETDYLSIMSNINGTMIGTIFCSLNT